MCVRASGCCLIIQGLVGSPRPSVACWEEAGWRRVHIGCGQQGRGSVRSPRDSLAFHPCVSLHFTPCYREEEQEEERGKGETGSYSCITVRGNICLGWILRDMI